MSVEHVHDLDPDSPRTTLQPEKPLRIFLMGASPAITGSGPLEECTGYQADPAAEKLKRTGGNTGNQVIAHGLLQTLDYKTLSWDYSIGPKRVNEEFDVIVVAAANFLHTGFDLGGMAAFIEATSLPCVMIGVGAQSNTYSTDIQLQPGTERLMRIVAERSALIGARGPFTADVLAAMGIQNVQVTGCPSYYMSARPDWQVRKPALPDPARLLINCSRDVVCHAFDRDRMTEVVCKLISIAIARDGDFAAQSEMPEIRIAESSGPGEFEKSFSLMMKEFPSYKNCGSEEALRAWASSHMVVFWDVANWYESMKRYDFVLGNRFHGNLIALQAGTPACVVCHDTRTTEMCEFLALPSASLSEFQELEVNELYDRVDPAAIKARYDVLYPRYKEFLQMNGLNSTLR